MTEFSREELINCLIELEGVAEKENERYTNGIDLAIGYIASHFGCFEAFRERLEEKN